MGRRGRIVSYRISGAAPQAAADHGAPIFPCWGFTRTAITIYVLKLAERGRADLDACLPDSATLDSYRQAVARDEEPWPREVLPGAAMRQGCPLPSGTGWACSNIGCMLARKHIEAVSQRPFPVLFKALIGDAPGLQGIEPATAREDFARVHWPVARRCHPGRVYHGCLTGTAADAARLLHGRFAGRVASHSGGGPFCVNAVYHVPDRPDPVTVACFADDIDEGRAEFAARCA